MSARSFKKAHWPLLEAPLVVIEELSWKIWPCIHGSLVATLSCRGELEDFQNELWTRLGQQ